MLTTIEVKFKKFRPEAHPPKYNHPSDTGADLYFCEDLSGVSLYSGEIRVFWTGIGLELPIGWGAQIRPRSGLSSQGVLAIFGSVDEGYRGQIGVTLVNVSRQQHIIQKGDRIAQLVVCPRYVGAFVEVDALAESDRNDKGFGSSGA